MVLWLLAYLFSHYTVISLKFMITMYQSTIILLILLFKPLFKEIKDI
jgi:hypothetical protein